MDSKEIPKHGGEPNGKLNEVLSPAKAVSSGMGDLNLIENEILAVEAETSSLEKKRETLERLPMAQQQRGRLKNKVEESQRVVFAGKKKCYSPGQLGHLQAECVLNNRVIKCWSCSEPGHFARDCTAAPKEGADDANQATLAYMVMVITKGVMMTPRR